MSAIAGTPAIAVMLARAGTPLTLSAAAGTPPTVVPAKPRKLAASRKELLTTPKFLESQMVNYFFVGVDSVQ
jgi:hypothetical protein